MGKKKESRMEMYNSFEGMEVSSDRLGGWNLRESSQTFLGFVA